MTETDGIYGGRFSGAGFKGCCMALVDSDKADGILEQVTEKYLSVYPDLKVNVHHLQYSRRGEVMKCIILAAGYATRLYPLTENFPKAAAEGRRESNP